MRGIRWFSTRRQNRGVALVAVVVLALAGAAALGWWFTSRSSNATAEPDTTGVRLPLESGVLNPC